MKHTRKSNDARFALLLLTPSLLGVCIFVFIPFADVIRRSFLTPMTQEFVGFANYQSVFSSKAFVLAAGNTIKFVLVCIPLLLVTSLAVSVMINTIPKRAAFFKSVLLIPMAVPAASIVLIWKELFHDQGLVNQVLSVMNLTPKQFFTSDTAFWVLVFTYLWKNIGYDIVLWLAGLAQIPEEIYEAASLDGASAFRKFKSLTLPMLKPTIFLVTVMSLINSFKVFREAYLIAGNYPQNSIYLLQHLFNNWFTSLDIQKLCAAAVSLALVIVFFLLLLKRYTIGGKT